MKHYLLTAILLFLAATFAAAQETKLLDPAQITATMKRVADWQLANPNGTELRDWVIAPLYDGLIDVSETTGDPQYLAAVVRMGTQSGWTPGGQIYFADDHAVGHAWLDIYVMDKSKAERLGPFKNRFDAILAKPIPEKLVYGTKPKGEGVSSTDRWTWCDALYMAPPTWARLAKATGDARYLDFLDAEYKATYDALFDPDENLFYRDERFIGKKTPSGKKVFWSRGNGWVFAGLPMLLEALPENHKTRQFYIGLFQKMAAALAATQQPDGLWYPSLLDPNEIATGETSGSAFFVYGFAWGVRHGLLDRAKYWPVVERGWNAILTRVNADGRVGFVQRIGDAPDRLSDDSTQLYGTGGVLMAGSEILRALDVVKKSAPTNLLAQAEKMLAADQTLRAYVRLVPERKDDLAWENDKVLYRIYGPALRAGEEASGIDAWAKKVARPVIDQWYADDLAGRQSYHMDHGEGYDGYKVGDSPGCGGIGIWQGGKLVQADVYDRANIYFTKPDVAEFLTVYTYPPINGKTYYERRRTRLKLGERLNVMTSRFTLDAEGKRPANDLDLAVGLMAQTPKAEFVFKPETGVMAVWDALQPGGEPFAIGAVVPPGGKMFQQPHTTTDPKADQAFAMLRTNAEGQVIWRAGFGWSGDGEFTSKQAALDYFETARQVPLHSVAGVLPPAGASGESQRAYQVAVLSRIVEPVLAAGAENSLKAKLPKLGNDRDIYAPLEALGRTVAGIAPWLELGPGKDAEGQLRARYIKLVVKAIGNAVDPQSPGFMNFREGGQPLVDTAFFAQALLRAPKQLWGNLDETSRANVIAALKSTRAIKPYESNWLLFSAMVEAALLEFTGECEMAPIEKAVSRHMEWYQGDGTYGDGPVFHWDYYNSFVIQPMLWEVIEVCARKNLPLAKDLDLVRQRAQRYAEVLERMISPEGTFPVIGRSSAYRFGAFQTLSLVALRGQLPGEMNAGAVRSGLNAVIKRMIEAPGTFDADGWLTIGVVGAQSKMAENYINRGSVYLCTVGLLQLGLPASDPFWTCPDHSWTQKRLWSGENFPSDHALRE